MIACVNNDSCGLTINHFLCGIIHRVFLIIIVKNLTNTMYSHCFYPGHSYHTTDNIKNVLLKGERSTFRVIIVLLVKTSPQ